MHAVYPYCKPKDCSYYVISIFKNHQKTTKNQNKHRKNQNKPQKTQNKPKINAKLTFSFGNLAGG